VYLLQGDAGLGFFRLILLVGLLKLGVMVGTGGFQLSGILVRTVYIYIYSYI
jgi:hypothetical protein